jgi:predicted nucleic acid-binding protein
MRILLDTNIIIPREDSQPIETNIQELSKILNKNQVTVLVHPRSFNDLNHNQDENKKNIMISKLLTYTFLDEPPNSNDDITYLDQIRKGSKINDYNDNDILYAVYRNAVDYLITEDLGIHRNAKRLKISERVFLIQDTIDFFNQYFSIKGEKSNLPALKSTYVYNLNIKDPFFESLKNSYPEFETKWFPKICREGRKCFVNLYDKKIGALLIYNIEEYDGFLDSTPILPFKKRLKLCTLKVSKNGQKIGELLLKIAFDIAIKNKITEIYLTLFSLNQQSLISLLQEFGFYRYGIKPNGEEIYLKVFISNTTETITSPKEYNQKFFPKFYEDNNIKKFIIPIRPEFHNRLFTDYPSRQLCLFEFDGEFYSEGNAIRKAYVSHSRIKNLNENDIILFYRSKDLKGITSLGIVDSYYSKLIDTNKIFTLIFRRTTFSRDEIENMRKPVSVILFKQVFHFKNPILYDVLLAENILKCPPFTIKKINDTEYERIKRIRSSDFNFALNKT